jgi:hypothetical protein
MDLEVTKIDAKPLKLTDRQQQQVVGFVLDVCQNNKDGRKPYEERWKKCEQAWKCEPDKVSEPQLQWRSNIFLPWAYDSVESWYAHMHSSIVPKDDDVFTIEGKTEEDDDGAEVMERYLQYRFEESRFPEQIGKILKQLAVKNHTASKTYWKEESRTVYEWQDQVQYGETIDPMTGMPTQVPTGVKKVRTAKEELDFNGVWIEPINIENFYFWPIRGDMEKATQVHETWKYHEDLMAAAESESGPRYFNLSEVKIDDETKPAQYTDADRDKKERPTQAGHNIKEAWIPRMVLVDENGKKTVARNYIATIVNDKTLIRFQPNPYDCGKTPFRFMALNQDGDCLYGFGLNSPGMQVLRAANFYQNCRLDMLKIALYPPNKYVDDGVFDPYNVVARPGAFLKVGSLDNLQPMQYDLSGIAMSYQEQASFRGEFDEATVPKVVRGQIDESGQTATEASLANNNSSGKMHIQAQRFNELILKPDIEMAYLLTYQRMQYDQRVKLEMAQITQPRAVPTMAQDPETGEPVEGQMRLLSEEEQLAQLPQLLPLPKVDVKVVGYQNSIRKMEARQNLQVFLAGYSQTPGAKYVKWYEVGELGCRLSEVPVDTVLVDEKKRDEIDQAEAQMQQQQMEMAQQQQELERMKLQMDFESKQADLALKAQDMQAKQEQQQNSFVLQAASAMQQSNEPEEKAS